MRRRKTSLITDIICADLTKNQVLIFGEFISKIHLCFPDRLVW